MELPNRDLAILVPIWGYNVGKLNFRNLAN